MINLIPGSADIWADPFEGLFPERQLPAMDSDDTRRRKCRKRDHQESFRSKIQFTGSHVNCGHGPRMKRNERMAADQGLEGGHGDSIRRSVEFVTFSKHPPKSAKSAVRPAGRSWRLISRNAVGIGELTRSALPLTLKAGLGIIRGSRVRPWSARPECSARCSD